MTTLAWLTACVCVCVFEHALLCIPLGINRHLIIFCVYNVYKRSISRYDTICEVQLTDVLVVRRDIHTPHWIYLYSMQFDWMRIIESETESTDCVMLWNITCRLPISILYIEKHVYMFIYEYDNIYEMHETWGHLFSREKLIARLFVFCKREK